PGGEPDTAFGIRGKAVYLHKFLSLWAFTGLVQPDGKIVVACRGYTMPNAIAVWDRIVLVRFTAQGRVDSSFGRPRLGEVLAPASDWVSEQRHGCRSKNSDHIEQLNE
ncbi:MAG: delta-60 repeat domain-containing protein, partial [Chthoniobacterales bacterium]